MCFICATVSFLFWCFCVCEGGNLNLIEELVIEIASITEGLLGYSVGVRKWIVYNRLFDISNLKSVSIFLSKLFLCKGFIFGKVCDYV